MGLMHLSSQAKLMSITAARKIEVVSIEDYLEGELRSEIKHEYLGGTVYATAGAQNVHNDVATSL